MPNTYTQLHIQIVFAVKYRQAMIHDEWEERLHQYITGIVQNNGHKILAINSAYDHIHILIGLNPNQSLSDLMQQVKRDSSIFVNDNKFTNSIFRWQEGYGAFSYSKSSVANVIKYIQQQKEHHKKKSFQEEYLQFLEIFDIEYDERYIFKDLT